MNTLTQLQADALPAFCALSAGLGAIIGSFLGVVAERIPQMMLDDDPQVNLLFPASHCPTCQHGLAWWQNIPLVSWLALRGRCHHCGSAIPLRLWLIEACVALFFGITAGCIPGLPALFSLWLLAAFLLPLALIDAEHQLLPDCLTQPLLWAGLLVHTFSSTLALRDAIIGAVAGYLVLWLMYWAFRLTTGREGIGHGDFKLLAALGAWCGWQALPDIVLLASSTGIITYFVLHKSSTTSRQIPFGPAIAFAGIITFIAHLYAFTL